MTRLERRIQLEHERLQKTAFWIMVVWVLSVILVIVCSGLGWLKLPAHVLSAALLSIVAPLSVIKTIIRNRRPFDRQ